MRAIHKVRTREDRRYRRHLRVRKKVFGTPERPRLVVFRSAKHIYAQLVDDTRGVTLFGAADTSEGIQVEGAGKTARSFALGQLIAARARERGIAKVVFDRGGYRYHGRVKAVAEGARKGGLEF
jgi:large subunit ribosomal protein L18